MENNPLVTVNILSFNRKEELRNTLEKVYGQDYKNIEVIVVDNASNDGSTEMVDRDFPNVILIKMQKNIGIAGWNEGFKIAKGEFVLVLDDDSYPLKDTIENAVNEITRGSENGIIACSVYDLQLKKNITEKFIVGEANAFIGCGALIRMTLLNSVGFFSKLFFLYLHEEDFCIRVIDKGFKIIFVPKSQIIHVNSKKNRRIVKNGIDNRRYYYGLRNILIFLFLYFNVSHVLYRMIVISAGRIIFGIRHKCFWISIKAILSFLFLLPKICWQRNIVSLNTQHYYEYGKILGGILYHDENTTSNSYSLLFKLKSIYDSYQSSKI